MSKWKKLYAHVWAYLASSKMKREGKFKEKKIVKIFFLLYDFPKKKKTYKNDSSFWIKRFCILYRCPLRDTKLIDKNHSNSFFVYSP
jgi:hypothetical protein